MKIENELIVKFMGLEPKKQSETLYTYSDGVWCSIRETTYEKAMNGIIFYVKYDNDWNWLMEVVSECYTCFINSEHKRAIEESLIGVININYTYKACIEFIKYYNENTLK